MVREAVCLSQDEFASKLGFKSRGAITNIERGLTTPSDNFLSLVSSIFEVRENWLRTGEGNMFSEETQDEKITAFIADLTQDDEDSFKKRFIEMLADLKPEEWAALEKVAEKLTQKKEEAP